LRTAADLLSPCNLKHIDSPTEVPTQDSHRWAVILAGGDGKRLLSLTRRIAGDDRPKQFCALSGGETLLKETQRRVARIIPRQQTLLILTRTHEHYYTDEVKEIPSSHLFIQPRNHGTAPAITYALTRLRRMDPRGLVAFFPSDHHFADDDAFAAHINFAFAQAKSHPARVILLGMEPEGPEQAYGWIEPGSPLEADSAISISEVSRFWEKPCRQVAAHLMRRGCLWNSFVMVGTVCAFRNMIERALPDLLASFESICALADPEMEEKWLRALYLKEPATNFSTEVLAARPSDLAVIHSSGLGWSDLGEPERVLSMLRLKSDGANA
jgi:mannose-1-phosphate guanylyltransferase